MGRIPLGICGLVVAVVLGGAVQGPSNRAGSNASSNQGDNGSSQDIRVATDLGRIASALEAQNAGDDAQREKRDLRAQEEMALWAERRTADAGDQMAEEAAKATAAALRSAAVAEQALVGVERPFVVIKPIRSNNQYAAYTFSNYGRTPAVIMHSDVRYLAMTPLDGPEPIRANVLQAALTPGWNVVPPGGEASSEEIVRPGKPIVEGAEGANMWLLHGYVMYRALTGEIFVSGFGIFKGRGEPWQALRGDAFNYDERLEKGGPRKRQRPTITVTVQDKPAKSDQGPEDD